MRISRLPARRFASLLAGLIAITGCETINLSYSAESIQKSRCREEWARCICDDGKAPRGGSGCAPSMHDVMGKTL